MIHHHHSGDGGGGAGEVVVNTYRERESKCNKMFTTGETGQWAHRCAIYKSCSYLVCLKLV